jgi:leucyl/phenylalanyl-tRNA---protein transferase
MRLMLDPQMVLAAYTQGAFPMTDPDGHTRWYTADPRGILPLDVLIVPRSLRQVVRRGKFEVRFNSDFRGVMEGCQSNRDEGTWIGKAIVDCYVKLNQQGFAHSVETWFEGKLAGGLYGVALGGVFFGESMFHYETDASKVALVALVQRLRERNFALLDTQAVTSHLSRFGAIEIPAADYRRRLEEALGLECSFD